MFKKNKKICDILILSIEQVFVEFFLLNSLVFFSMFFVYISLHKNLNGDNLIALNQIYVNVIPLYVLSLVTFCIYTYSTNLRKYYNVF